ncbi:hypothetical protein [Haladaptatus salinisoli]|uniref:hypothetical protein n=1 Tax=Haladaptatus salinisoli TaxID=2884876 RepID=UPI001D0A2C44|nr:hypothetical protein [Haladaptatus salinisoli]
MNEITDVEGEPTTERGGSGLWWRFKKGMLTLILLSVVFVALRGGVGDVGALAVAIVVSVFGGHFVYGDG